MAKFKVHLETALKLIPHLVLRPQAFSVQSVSPLTVEIVHPDQDWVVDTINLLCRKDPTIKATQPTDQWGYFDDMSFPLTSPADLREPPLSIYSTDDGLDAMRPYAHTVTGRISDPQPQPVVYGGSRGGKVRGTPNGLTVKPCPYRHPPTAVCPHCQDWERKRVPASVGSAPACPMTDTCFDSDPSLVGE